MKKSKGITLIALIITIIIMLILVGITINYVIQTNLLETAKTATKRTADAAKEEQYLGNSMNIEGMDFNSVDSYIQFMEGINDVSITVTSGDQEIQFNNTIKSDKYEIIGISAEKEGTYITTGSIEGKTGTLEIVGDIKDTTFKYNLNKIMLGDETFYCKAQLNDEEYYQEIKVIQGDVVKYEEDFLEFLDSPEGEELAGKWQDIEGDCWSGGKAKYILNNSTSSKSPTISSYFNFEFYGGDYLLCWGQKKTGDTTMVVNIYKEEEKIKSILLMHLDRNESEINRVYRRNPLGNSYLLPEIYLIKTQVAYSPALTGGICGMIVIDGVEVYRNNLGYYDDARE